ncbi:MAG: hypothetical protein KME60_04360 [Cyanomargarita calcarea GSE-NOS-MK-12-04C]|uniref:Uncharacterized protein n=1 Tax=Cyanomargarita calcarea GSE-NOS-MK-12-04C TaxID=2839659 RepID=A0A951QHR6_9CYAN|nr:hypothetical protein [Cyanomargarita calcarea GSE-NOS-MK-12-04C]
MIFILASGYLFTIYLLLALAKRNEKKASPDSPLSVVKRRKQEELGV